MGFLLPIELASFVSSVEFKWVRVKFLINYDRLLNAFLENNYKDSWLGLLHFTRRSRDRISPPECGCSFLRWAFLSFLFLPYDMLISCIGKVVRLGYLVDSHN